MNENTKLLLMELLEAKIGHLESMSKHLKTDEYKIGYTRGATDAYMNILKVLSQMTVDKD